MYLYGASGHAKVIIEILESQGIQVQGLFDDNMEKHLLLDYPVKRFNPALLENNELIIAIGDNKLRKELATKILAKYGQSIHPAATISKRSTIGEGTVIMGHAIINSNTRIGKHCIINTSASVDHDCVIEDCCHISPNATITGNVTVGEGSWIGAGATIINGITIGKWCTIGAGAVIIRNVPNYATVVGNPGKIIKIAEH